MAPRMRDGWATRSESLREDMSDGSSWWRILTPVTSHALETLGLAIIVHGTSLGLGLILPPDVYHLVHRVELFFYIAMAGSLAVYTFLVFCFTLALQFVETVRRSMRKYEIESRRERRRLTAGRALDEVPSSFNKKVKDRV